MSVNAGWFLAIGLLFHEIVVLAVGVEPQPRDATPLLQSSGTYQTKRSGHDRRGPSSPPLKYGVSCRCADATWRDRANDRGRKVAARPVRCEGLGTVQRKPE